MHNFLRYVDIRWVGERKFDLPDFKEAAERIVAVNEFPIAPNSDGSKWIRVWIQTHA